MTGGHNSIINLNNQTQPMKVYQAKDAIGSPKLNFTSTEFSDLGGVGNFRFLTTTIRFAKV